MSIDELESSIQKANYDNVATEAVENAQMLISAAGFVLAAANEGLIPDPSLMRHLTGSTEGEWPSANEIVEFLHSQAQSQMSTAKDVEITKSYIR